MERSRSVKARAKGGVRQKLLAGKYTAALLGSSDYRASGFETRVTAEADPRENSAAKLPLGLESTIGGGCRFPSKRLVRRIAIPGVKRVLKLLNFTLLQI